MIICEKYSHFAQSAPDVFTLREHLQRLYGALFGPAMLVVKRTNLDRREPRYAEENAVATVKNASG